MTTSLTQPGTLHRLIGDVNTRYGGQHVHYDNLTADIYRHGYPSLAAVPEPTLAGMVAAHRLCVPPRTPIYVDRP